MCSDIIEMSERINVLNRNRPKVLEMGLKAREYVLQNHSIEKNFEKIFKIFLNTLKQ